MTRSAGRILRGGVRRLAVGLLLLAMITSVAGCGLGTAGGFIPTGRLSGALAGVPTLDRAPIAVGSKEFTEQRLLGKIAVILLASAGASVTDLTAIPGSASARQAQLAGQVDLMWEYTGTAWISYLGETEAIPDEAAQYEAVRDRDLAQNRLVWLPPAPMNNGYGFAMNAQTSRELGITTLSELPTVDTADLTFCVAAEFASRNDGFQPMLQAYGVRDLPPGNVRVLGEGAMYQANADGLCNFAQVTTTDGRIKALDLTVLADDQKFFPRYNAAVVVRADTMAADPQIAALFAPVAARLDDETMLELNARIDVDGEEPVDVAQDWLRAEGFIG